MGIREMEAQAREDLLGVRDRGPQGWLAWRAPVWIRLLVVVMAGAGVIAGAQWTAAAYRETVAYRQAAHCPVGGGAGAGRCVGLEATGVVDKAELQGCSGTGSNRNCSTKYKLRISRSLRTEWLEVRADLYDAARRGSRAELQTWQGSVVGITVRGRTQMFPPLSEDSMWIRTAAIWLLLGLALWAGLSGLLGTLLRPAGAGWAFFTLPLVFIVDNALFGADVGKWLVTIALAVGVVGGTIGAHRYELQKKTSGR